MSKVNLGRLIDSPHYSFEDFSKSYSLARTKPKYTYSNPGPKRLPHSLTSLLSGIYNHDMIPRLMLDETKSLLNKKEIYNNIVDNIHMIESTLLCWIATQFGKRKPIQKVESIESFASKPLIEQIERTQGRVPLEYLNDRNLENLLQFYKRLIDIDKIENPGRYGKTRKLKQTP